MQMECESDGVVWCVCVCMRACTYVHVYICGIMMNVMFYVETRTHMTMLPFNVCMLALGSTNLHVSHASPVTDTWVRSGWFEQKAPTSQVCSKKWCALSTHERSPR